MAVEIHIDKDPEDMTQDEQIAEALISVVSKDLNQERIGRDKEAERLMTQIIIGTAVFVVIVVVVGLIKQRREWKMKYRTALPESDNDTTSWPDEEDTTKYGPVRAQQTVVLSHNAVKPEDEVKKNLPSNRNREVERLIQQRDPLFSADHFITYAQKVYLSYEDAEADGNLSLITNLLSIDFYAVVEKQIKMREEVGIVTKREGINIVKAHLSDYKKSKAYEFVTVTVVSQMVEYQYTKTENRVIKGHRGTMVYKRHYMKFARSLSAFTDQPEEETALTCPNCGAPLDEGNFDVCSFCGSVVHHDNYNWILSDFGIIDVDTTDEGVKA